MEKESKYAVFRYQKCDEDLVEGLAEYLDAHAYVVFDFFEVDPPKDRKVAIDIIPTKREFNFVYIKDRNLPLDYHVPRWIIGTSVFIENKIVYLSLHDYKSTSHPMREEPFEKAYEYYKKTILHEFVHYVHGIYREKNNCESPIRCFGEGIACYLSGQKEGKNIKFDFTLEQLMSGEIRYDAYYLITKYLVENYDKEFALKILSDNQLSKDFLMTECYEKANKYYLERT